MSFTVDISIWNDGAATGSGDGAATVSSFVLSLVELLSSVASFAWGGAGDGASSAFSPLMLEPSGYRRFSMPEGIMNSAADDATGFPAVIKIAAPIASALRRVAKVCAVFVSSPRTAPDASSPAAVRAVLTKAYELSLSHLSATDDMGIHFDVLEQPEGKNALTIVADEARSNAIAEYVVECMSRGCAKGAFIILLVFFSFFHTVGTSCSVVLK